MSFRTARFVLPVAAFALIGLGFTPTARAQPNPAAPAATDPTKSTDPALKGPAIGERNRVRGKSPSGFGSDSIEKKKAGGKKPTPPVSMSAFLQSLNVLHSAPTPEATRLTGDQDAKIKAMAADFETSVKQYMDTNRTELDALRAKLGPTDRAMLEQQLQRGGQIRLSKAGFGGKAAVARQRAGGKGKGQTPTDPAADTTTEPSKEEAAKTRTRLVEIYAGRPKSEDAQAGIMGVLTPDQLTIVEKQLANHDGLDTPRRHAGKGKPKGA